MNKLFPRSAKICPPIWLFRFISFKDQLADIGVVTKTKLGRDNFYINKRLFNLLMNTFHYEQFGEKKIIRTE